MRERLASRIRKILSPEEMLHDKLFRTQISVNTDLNKAQLTGKPIFMVARSSVGAKDYQALTQELIERIESV